MSGEEVRGERMIEREERGESRSEGGSSIPEC